MASRGVNKVILVGHLGKDPELRNMPNGGAVANLTIATSDTWRDKQSGEQKEKTEWHRVALFGKLADIAGQYLRKGSQVYIEGKLQTRKWQDQNGQDRHTTEIVVQGFEGVMQMLDSRGHGGDSAQHYGRQGGQQQGGFNQQPGGHHQGPQSGFDQPPGGQAPQGGFGQAPQGGFGQPPQPGIPDDGWDDDVPF